MFDALNGEIAENQDRIIDLAQTILSMTDGSTATGQKLESGFGYLESNLHTIQIQYKDENIIGLEAHRNEETRKLNDSMKSLESYRMHEIQSFHENMVAMVPVLEDTESDSSQSDTCNPIKHQENIPNVVMGISLVFPVTMTEKNAIQKYLNSPMTYQ